MKQRLINFVAWWADFFDSVARARAAAELARHGHHQAANRLINGESIV
jgi:hypothetical protein